MARRRHSRKLGSTVIGGVKVCKMDGKKLVCKSVKAHKSSRRRLGSVVLNGSSCRTAKGKFKKC